jgi:hypothetical protein
VEICNREERRQCMVGDYLKASRKTKSVRTAKGLMQVPKQCLLIVPAWGEMDEVTGVLRERLKGEGRLPKSGQSFKILRDGHWTLAEKKNLRKFRGGEVLVFHKGIAGFGKHEEVRVLGVKGRELEVQRRDGRKALLSARQGSAYSVYKEKEVELCAGDRIRLGANAVDQQGKKLSNGSMLTVQGVDRKATISWNNSDSSFAIKYHGVAGGTDIPAHADGRSGQKWVGQRRTDPNPSSALCAIVVEHVRHYPHT